MLYVGKSDKPEIYKRIITYRHDSGDAEGATEYCNKAIEENLDIHFTRNDLRRVLDNARQAIEERKAKKLAEEKAIKERRAGERAIRREESNALLQENLDTYLNALETMGVSTVRKIEVTQRGNIWTATLSVDNAWHLSPYQIRLQNAQTLWKTWAQIASPDKPDSARISIVDLNGNEVGGSRMLAGSLIWVQKN
jgi:regulator of replication initiation timing